MKSKFKLSMLMLILLALALSSCGVPFRSGLRGSGNIVTESRDVSGFSKVQLDGAGTLTITQGETASLQIRSDDNVLPELTSDVVGNTLVLGIEEDWWRRSVLPTQGIKYTLTVVDLSDITINGAADLSLDDFQTDTLTIEINGAGDIDISNLEADDFEVVINGTANALLSGEVENLFLSVNGMGNVSAGALFTQSADVEINGLGNGTVWAVDSLSISISGGGSLSYYGYPTLSQDVSGAGNITALGEK